MTEPTEGQKMDAARAALEAMKPPVPETDVTARLVEVMVALFWSQAPLLPASQPAPAGVGSMFVQPVVPPTPELEARVAAHNAEGAAILEACVLHTNP